MAIDIDLRCETDRRRATLLAQRGLGVDITGIDYVVVSADQRSLEVFFIDREPPAELVTGRLELFEVTGGRRVRVRVVDVGSTPGTPSSLHLELSSPGDFSDYVLEIHQPSGGPTILDELYRRCAFNFKVQCPARFDCEPPAEPIEPPPPGIEVDYLAKDYASFRQGLVDLIPRLSPQWTERLAADFGMTILELLAYTGDQLSYYQDAVANEAYLETARQRVSVRRHARLVDYQMHDGASARAFVHLRLRSGTTLTIPKDTPLQLLTRIDVPFGPAPPEAVIPERYAVEAMDTADTVFESFTSGDLDARLNEIVIHDWGDEDCVVPRGATSVDLRGDLRDVLGPGDLLLFEEMADPATGDATLADPTRRQVVRLTGVSLVRDNLGPGVDLTRVAWDPADALAFPLTIGVDPTGRPVSIARGNLLLADHGRTISESGRTPDPIASGNRAARFLLDQGPLAFRPAVPASGPAAILGRVDPHGAAPQVKVASEGVEWNAAATLLSAGAFDPDVAVETVDDGRGLLRFGDNVFGLAPEEDAAFDVVYRVGIGVEGNVGADAIHHVLETGDLAVPLADVVEAVRNPLPAWGGIEPESIEAVRVDAPAAFRASQDRAVTEADYAAIAERHELVRRAVARFRWTGSWHTVFISIDPAGRHGLEPPAAASIAAFVERFAQAGYDLEIVPPHYVPLALTLEVCVDPDHFRPDVEEAIRATLTSGLRPHGQLGFFHPDNFTFGQALFLSRLYATVADVDGVDSVVATRFGRLGDDEPESGGPISRRNLDRGEISIGPLEIARLDDDPDFPENGLIRLDMQGGK
jgi:hypothetical protein